MTWRSRREEREHKGVVNKQTNRTPQTNKKMKTKTNRSKNKQTKHSPL